jgi:hypothetical protein
MSVTTDPAARADITARRQAGESLATIGTAYGITRERVRQLCTKWGVTSPVDLRTAPPEAIEAALAAMRAGASQGAAAQAAGITASTLRRHIQLLGVELPAAPDTAERWAGRSFGLWTALPNSYQYDAAKPSSRSVECRCECGTVRRVQISNLLSGVSRGCGCRTSTGQRKRTPWVCTATGQRFETTAALARHLGVNNLVLTRRLNRGESYTDGTGRVWAPDREAAVPHIARPWVCIQTGEQWADVQTLAQHLGVVPSSLAQALHKGRAYPATDGLHYCPAGREAELEVRPRHLNASNAVRPQAWVCDQTGEQWPSRGQLEKHLGLGSHGLARRDAFTDAEGRTYRRVEQQQQQQGVAA